MLALEGIKVLDLTHVAPGNLCTMILANLGAEIIRIEPLAEGRSLAIHTSPKSEAGEEKLKEAAYYPLSRNKKSIGLNLRSDAGYHVFYRLAEKADVIVEGFRPGVVKRLKVDYETISKLNPKIVYCSLSGYGQDGPYRSLPGHDINYISIGGAFGLIGNSEGDTPIIPLNLIGDFAGASLHGVIGIMTALIARNKTGRGQHVDIAFLDGVISLLTYFTESYFFDGTVPKRGETALHGAYPYYGAYKTKDGKYISIGCIESFLWENLCRALGKEDYIPYHFSAEHFLHKPKDDKWKEISSYLKKTFLTKTRDEWFDLLSKKDIPIAKVYTLDEVFSDPQVLHRQMLVEVEHPRWGKIKQAGIPIKLSETPGKIRSLSPLFGEHTKELLLELGYSPEEIKGLYQAGAIG